MKRIVTRIAFIAMTVSVFPAIDAQQIPVASEERNPDIFFVLGNLEFILLHELAHVLISDLDIPVIGSEESAADYIATLAMINADRFDETTAQRARQFLFATANGLATSWESSANSGAEIQFWGSHALTIQRFYQMICLIHGSDPVEFAGLPARVGMPESRSALCANELARANRSFEWLLENYGRAPGDPPGAEIGLVFESAPTRVSRRIQEALIADGMLDRTIDRLHELFTIRTPFNIAFRACRDPQAMWISDRREITVCYALLDAYYVLARTTNAARRQSELGQP